ncbi:TetR/AcrR family transcriptional regulator [Ktedonosporobacter rubrisoli]|uniref:TetR/AcrR family transcriptional regulator n=1 Tax=Ktedonosporobacter rubrisoli TaxID=2509675 RepID=A0A4P6JMK7_KTERU|nr:TetR/AcrR family transcriptional regulator [Ktedonosporobacter rubrisoli]QBD76517.1 TetR/AcrR family transcriptional regulator [Ktedonosporobacter rubrisoli]
MPARTPERSLRETLRQKRAEFILETAEEVIIEKGYHAASMDEIAERAGVSKGTLYQHFSTKDELIFALIEQRSRQFGQLIEQVDAAPISAQDKLERILYAIHVEQQLLSPQLLHLLSHEEELRRKILERRQLWKELREQIMNQLTAILDEGKAEGVFDPEMATGLMLYSFVQLLALRGQEQRFALDHLTAEEAVEQIGRLFFAGIKRKS